MDDMRLDILAFFALSAESEKMETKPPFSAYPEAQRKGVREIMLAMKNAGLLTPAPHNTTRGAVYITSLDGMELLVKYRPEHQRELDMQLERRRRLGRS
jgi:hypothetical protein